MPGTVGYASQLGLGVGEPSNHLGCISVVNGFKAGREALGGKELSKYFLDFLSALNAELSGTY